MQLTSSNCDFVPLAVHSKYIRREHNTACTIHTFRCDISQSQRIFQIRQNCFIRHNPPDPLQCTMDNEYITFTSLKLVNPSCFEKNHTLLNMYSIMNCPMSSAYTAPGPQILNGRSA